MIKRPLFAAGFSLLAGMTAAVLWDGQTMTAAGALLLAGAAGIFLRRKLPALWLCCLCAAAALAGFGYWEESQRQPLLGLVDQEVEIEGMVAEASFAKNGAMYQVRGRCPPGRPGNSRPGGPLCLRRPGGPPWG